MSINTLGYDDPPQGAILPANGFGHELENSCMMCKPLNFLLTSLFVEPGDLPRQDLVYDFILDLLGTNEPLGLIEVPEDPWLPDFEWSILKTFPLIQRRFLAWYLMNQVQLICELFRRRFQIDLNATTVVQLLHQIHECRIMAKKLPAETLPFKKEHLEFLRDEARERIVEVQQYLRNRWGSTCGEPELVEVFISLRNAYRSEMGGDILKHDDGPTTRATRDSWQTDELKREATLAQNHVTDEMISSKTRNAVARASRLDLDATGPMDERENWRLNQLLSNPVFLTKFLVQRNWCFYPFDVEYRDAEDADGSEMPITEKREEKEPEVKRLEKHKWERAALELQGLEAQNRASTYDYCN